MSDNKFLGFFKRYYFLLLPIAITVLSMVFFHPYYDIGKDDMVLSNMVNSAQTNEHSEYLVFISIYLGFFMRFFALMFPTLSVYEITLLVAFTGAFITFFYNTRKYENKLFTITLLTGLQVFLLFGITFTIVAFICSAAGVMLVLENVPRMNKKAIGYFLLAFLFIFVGLGYRRGSLATCVFLLFVPTWFFAVKNKRNSLAVVLALVVLFSGTHQFLKISQSTYTQNLLGEDYVTFNRYRGVASDGGDLRYEDHQELFDLHNITKNDVKMYNNFRFNDKTVFPTEKVKIMAESLSEENKYLFDFGKLMQQTFDSPFLYVFLVVGVFCLVFLKKNRLEVLGTIVFVLVAVLYLHFRKRGIDRVVNPIIFIGLMLLVYRYLSHEVSLTQKVYAKVIRHSLTVLLLIFAIGLPLYSHWVGHQWVSEKDAKSTAKIVAHIRADKEHKYVSFSSLSNMRNLSLTRKEPIAENLITNVYVGWMVYTPYWYDLLELHGIDEYKDCLYLSLADPEIRVLCNSSATMESLELAVEENYGVQIQRRLGMVRDGRQIYQMWELKPQ